VQLTLCLLSEGMKGKHLLCKGIEIVEEMLLVAVVFTYVGWLDLAANGACALRVA